MAVSPARATAFEVLLRVEREESYAAELLHSDRLAKLSSRDHGLATELVMGVLRWQSLLDRRLAAASSQKLERLDGEVLAALRLGVYQLQFLSRVPARVAIFESVELVKAARKRSAGVVVNAGLLTIDGAGAEDISAEDVLTKSSKSPDSIALARNAAHPQWLVARWTEHYGVEAARQICAHDQTVPGTVIHIHGDPSYDDQSHDDQSHDDRSHDDQSSAELAEEGVQLAPGRLLSAARRVLSADVTATRAYQEGRVSIQDEASQLVAMLVGRGETIVDGAIVDGAIVDCAILDCCAAPGSKTALLARRNPHAKVFATELHPHRARLLQNLSRLPNVHVVAADARHLPFSFAFERILADAPCYGTGTLGGRFEGRAGATAAVWRDVLEGYRVASRWTLSENNSRRASLRRILCRDDRTEMALHKQKLADFEIHRPPRHDFLSWRRSLGHDHARRTGLGNRRRRNRRGLWLAGRRRSEEET